MIINNFTPEWKLWIWTNIVNGLDREIIFNILLNHGFKYDLIKYELDIDPINAMIWQRQYSQKELEKPYEKEILPLNKSLIDYSNVYRIENNFLELYRIPEFSSLDECDKIIKQDDNIIDLINKKFDSYVGLNSLPEDITEIKMITGNEKIFKNFSDWSAVLFLENVFKDNEISFPSLDINFKHVKGDVIIWKNIYHDNTFNPHSECLNVSPEKEGNLILIKNYNIKNLYIGQEININGI
jgi:hypothetical protein